MAYHCYDNPTAALQVAAAVADSTGTGVWLSGHGAPPSGSGMLPLDGVNDPWRWSPGFDQWIGPAYTVHITEGDLPPYVMPSSDVIAGVAELDLYFNANGRIPDALHGLGSVLGTGSLTLCSNGATFTEPDWTFDRTGDVVVWLAQAESGWTGPTAVPFPALDVLDFLGDLPVVGPFEFTELTPIGLPGQFYFDKDTRDVYLRDDTSWTKVSTLPVPA
jgi:hypothetical protein